MKKTLVALAVLAASGAAMAQVSLTGTITFGHISTTDGKTSATGTTVTSSGLGFYTSEVYFNANEDLGGGYKMAVRYGLGGIDRSGESAKQPYYSGSNGPVTGRNATLALTTPFGLLTMGTTKVADYLNAYAGLGVNIDDLSDLWSNALFAGRQRRDQVTFQAPVGPVTLIAGHYEAGNDLGAGDGSAGPNTSVAGLGQRIDFVGATYASGPLVVNAQYLSYDNQWSPRAGALADGNINNVDRFAINYDFGMAKVGYALQIQNNTGDFKATQQMVGLKVPLGAITLGTNIGQRKVEGSTAGAAVNGTRAGYLLFASYNLSKRTSLMAQYSNFETSAIAGQENSSNTYLLMSHSF
jgi:hypothetical protein